MSAIKPGKWDTALSLSILLSFILPQVSIYSSHWSFFSSLSSPHLSRDLLVTECSQYRHSWTSFQTSCSLVFPIISALNVLSKIFEASVDEHKCTLITTRRCSDTIICSQWTHIQSDWSLLKECIIRTSFEDICLKFPHGILKLIFQGVLEINKTKGYKFPSKTSWWISLFVIVG